MAGKKIKIKGEEFDVSDEKYIDVELQRELIHAIKLLGSKL